jgi:hypothetical protein
MTNALTITERVMYDRRLGCIEKASISSRIWREGLVMVMLSESWWIALALLHACIEDGVE